MVMNTPFWKNKKVFITGHTGFKGGWLSIWLQSMGASLTGYSLAPASSPNLFTAAKIEDGIKHIIGDIRDNAKLKLAMKQAEPDIVFHLAAQPLVRRSYQDPEETYSTNVMGTVNLLEAVRQMNSVRIVINVTSDKCYENKEWLWGYRESDRLGGYDPYSNSKACSELVTQAYQNSFFTADHHIKLVSARAGNVIGGGDWSEDRLIPDFIRAYLNRQPIHLRYPESTRPWQHVLEPLSGYLLLAEKLSAGDIRYDGAWNFGPEDADVCSVGAVVSELQGLLDERVDIVLGAEPQLHEARLLKLDCSRAKSKLGWMPKWNLESTLKKTAEWYMAYKNNEDMRSFSLKQLNDFIMCPVKESNLMETL